MADKGQRWPRPERVGDGEPDDDEVIAIARARAGDHAAFSDLYRRYVDATYRYCLRRLGNREDAEDATSRIFMKALAGIAGFHGASFRAWLFTIAHHTVVDGLRVAKPTWSLDVATGVPDRAPSPEEVAVAAEAGRRVRTILADLPEDGRQILELRLAGLTAAEIAAVLGRSQGAVRTAQYRALRRLRARFVMPIEEAANAG